MSTAPDPSTLLSFRNSLRSCTKCPLHEGCTAPVPWYGDTQPDIALIGEAPGRTEDREGKPFVGVAGTRMRYMLKDAGINPDTVTYLNAVSCWPDGTPKDLHIDACRSWMRGQIAFIQPTYIITVGVIALQSVRNATTPKLRELHGKPLHWDNPPVPAKPRAIWPVYHPSAALRSRKYEKMIEADLAAFVKWRAEGEPVPEDCYICGDTLYRFTEEGIALCKRHSQIQGRLFAEDVLTT